MKFDSREMEIALSPIDKCGDNYVHGSIAVAKTTMLPVRPNLADPKTVQRGLTHPATKQTQVGISATLKLRHTYSACCLHTHNQTALT